MSEGFSEEEAIMKSYADVLPQMALKRPGTVEDIVNAVVFLASDQSDFITGQAINVCGGWLMAH